MTEKGILHFFTGKMAAGKSTLSKQIAANEKAVLICEDDWLTHLYEDEIGGLHDYVVYASKLKPLLNIHVANLLDSGVSVVLDFPANTRLQRQWFADLIDAGSYKHRLHYIEASDHQCLQQLRERSEGLADSAFSCEEMFHQMTRYFQAPEDDEPFNITVYQRDKDYSLE